MSLSGFAYVTGAASGIGKAVCIAYASAGVSGICLVDKNVTALRPLARELSDIATNKEFRTIVYVADLILEDDINGSVEKAFGEFGRIDYAVNCAGVGQGQPGPVSDIETEDFEFVDSINHRGLFLCLRAQLRKMKSQSVREVKKGRPGERGVIVNIASTAGGIALRNNSSYTSSKHAVIGLTKSAAIDHGADKIRVNSVSPGFVDTPLLEPHLSTPGVMSHIETKTLLNRLGEAEEIADVVLFLSGGQASYITGQNLVVDGGYTTNLAA